MYTRGIFGLAAFALFAAGASAQDIITPAEPAPEAPKEEASRIRASLTVGTEVAIDSDFSRPGSASSINAAQQITNPTLVNLFGPTIQVGEVNVQARDFRDIMAQPLTVSAELGYALTPKSEAFVAVRYFQAEAEGPVSYGSVRFLGDYGSAPTPVTAEFGDYSALSLEVGYRRSLTNWAVKPFVGVRAGVVQTDGMDLTIRAPVANLTSGTLPLFEDGTTYMLGIDAGLEYKLGDRFSLGAESGYRFVGELSGDDSRLKPLALDGLNNVDPGWSVPLSVRGSVRF
jgi:hypothetical protein